MNAAGKILIATTLTGLRSAAQTATGPTPGRVSRTVRIFVAGTAIAVGFAVAETWWPQLVGSFATLVLVSSALANIGGVLGIVESFTTS